MINNHVLRSIRYMLDLSDLMVIQTVKLADTDFVIEKASVSSYLKKEDELGYLECSDAVLAHFLDGLVIHCRGKNKDQTLRPVETRMNNNLVLKKLRVAFEMKDADLISVFKAAGFPVAKAELSALFRQHDHRNFRLCGDQMLRNFLKGLTLRIRS
jgi:uncharacterized protein YehS (DUF1456 family)